MEITDLRRTKRGRISVYLENEFACVLHTDVYLLSGLKVGQELDRERLSELYAASQERFARERALNLLSARSYTAKGLRDKLMEKLEDGDAADGIVDRMQELGLVDDRDYALRYAKDCLNQKGYSRSRAAQALREKGIDRHLADEVLAELEQDPQEAIARVVARKYLRYLEDEKGVRKTVAALQRLGYRYGDIRAVLQNLSEDTGWYDDLPDPE